MREVIIVANIEIQIHTRVEGSQKLTPLCLLDTATLTISNATDYELLHSYITTIVRTDLLEYTSVLSRTCTAIVFKSLYLKFINVKL